MISNWHAASHEGGMYQRINFARKAALYWYDWWQRRREAALLHHLKRPSCALLPCQRRNGQRLTSAKRCFAIVDKWQPAISNFMAAMRLSARAPLIRRSNGAFRHYAAEIRKPVTNSRSVPVWGGRHFIDEQRIARHTSDDFADKGGARRHARRHMPSIMLENRIFTSIWD